jgi:hypothetical protein
VAKGLRLEILNHHHLISFKLGLPGEFPGADSFFGKYREKTKIEIEVRLFSVVGNGFMVNYARSKTLLHVAYT